MKNISETVTYIGVDDLVTDLFEGQYVIPEGISYNSYLVRSLKTAVMDTVDECCASEWKDNLKKALDGAAPDYLVLHHVEPDHSGAVAWALEEYPSMQLVCTAKAVQMLSQFCEGVPFAERAVTVADGDILSLGNHVLKFFTAPMVHWPEVMVSWLEGEGILFSADAFGKFGALSKCGFTGEEDDDWACEARRYYFNICGKYGLQVQALLKKVLPLAPKAILPLHGPVLESNLDYYLGLYDTWSKYAVESEGVFIAHASIHGNTAKAALKLKEILEKKGCPKVAVSDLCRDDMAEAVEDAFRYGRMVVAASSYDAGLFTPAYNFIHTLQMKAWQKRRVALIENGSWAPSAGRVMKEMFSQMKEVEIIGETVTVRSALKESDIPALEALADGILQD